MPRLRNSQPPKYRRHKQSGQAIVTLSDPTGRRRDYLLGPYGSPESRAEYARLIAEWMAGGGWAPNAGRAPADLTLNEVVARFWVHAKQHYRHSDGTPTSEVKDYRCTLKPLVALYGHTLARNFGPLALKGPSRASACPWSATDWPGR